MRVYANDKMTELERSFCTSLTWVAAELEGYPEPENEYKFDDNRKWKFDFAWPQVKIAVEVEGGTWTNGRHTRGAGFERDCEKYNAATLAGWQVYRFTSGQIESGAAAATTLQALLKPIIEFMEGGTYTANYDRGGAPIRIYPQKRPFYSNIRGHRILF